MVVSDFQEELFDLLWKRVYQEASYFRSEEDLNHALEVHIDDFIDLARRVIQARGGIPENGILIPDDEDDWHDGGSMEYWHGALHVTIRANCEDGWWHRIEFPVPRSDLLCEEEVIEQ